MTEEPLSFDLDGTPQEMRQLGDWLDAYNAVQTGVDDMRPLKLAVRDSGGRLVGGLHAMTSWGWLYVMVVFVEEKQRGRGVGTRLMQMAEQEARSRGCENACLTSYSFQNPGFYQRRGYEVFGKLEGYPTGQTMFFMRKRLRD